MARALLTLLLALFPLTASAQVLTTYINYAVTSGTTISNRQPGTYLRFICATAADLPSANVIDGDRGFANDSGRAYSRVGGVWTLVATDQTANALITTSQTGVLPVGAIADGQFLKRDGANIVGATPTASAAWGGITGTLSAQTDLQTALNGKQASGTYATGTGTANGTNTGDQTTITGNAGTATTLQNARTINGVSFNGSTNIVVPAAGSTLTDNVPTSKLNSGTGATSSTYWRGDGSWATPAGGSGPSYVVTSADTTNATTTYANITGLVFNVAASTRYRISCLFPYDANATTTGIGIGWVGPASPTLTRALMTSGLTTATTGGTTIAGNDTGATTTASVATTGNVASFEGIWSNGSTAGTIQLRVKSEVAVANAIIVRTGAVCSYAVY